MWDRNRQLLDGEWQYSLPGDEEHAVPREVPGSYRCVGDSVYSRRFVWNGGEGRWDLCFEGIAYEGTVFLNGIRLGTMEPYSSYRFDVTAVLCAGENRLEVSLQDITAVFGPSLGWRNYSGIIRSVFLEQKPAIFIDDVFFHYTFSEAYHEARCIVDVRAGGIDGKEEARLEAALSLEGKTLSAASVSASSAAALTFDLHAPQLWSPEHPVLYTLRVVCRGPQGEDSYTCAVGFKDFQANGDRLTLNGKPLFLMGVCRHELWEDDQGHTLSMEQTEQDMRMIKEMGANFVRLVHYPQDRRVLDMADRIGLLVSEEPGFWWSDVSDKELAQRGLEVLRRTIERDRNHVSVAFWLSFNECVLTVEFLRAAVQLARRTDPTRLISGANCMDVKLTKQLFDEAGCDFYTFHPYGADKDHVSCGVDSDNRWDRPLQSLENVCRVLSGKPVIFTEWGGFFHLDEPRRLQDYCAELFRLADNAPGEPVLAGASYWIWADYYEANRATPASVEGVTIEGLTDMRRNPRIGYQVLREAIARRACPREPYPGRVECCSLPAGGGDCVSLELPDAGSPEQKALWEAAKERYIHYMRLRFSKEVTLKRGPELPGDLERVGSLPIALRKGPPLVITKDAPLSFQVNAAAGGILFIGQTSFTGGYPHAGTRGEPVGEYVLEFADGTRQSIPLRNGWEVTAASCLCGATRTEPSAPGLQKAMTLVYDPSYELYTVQLLRRKLDSQAVLNRCTLHVTSDDYTLLLYGAALEK